MGSPRPPGVYPRTSARVSLDQIDKDQRRALLELLNEKIEAVLEKPKVEIEGLELPVRLVRAAADGPIAVVADDPNDNRLVVTAVLSIGAGMQVDASAGREFRVGKSLLEKLERLE